MAQRVLFGAFGSSSGTKSLPWPTNTPDPTRTGDYAVISDGCRNHTYCADCPLPNRRRAFKRGPPERWPSGLRRTLGKRVCGKPYRGFESHSLRHASVRHRSRSFSKFLKLSVIRVLFAQRRLPLFASIPTSNVGRNGGTHGANNAPSFQRQGQERQDWHAL